MHRFINVSTSILGRFKLSLLKAYTVSYVIPISLHQKTVFSRFLSPSECPLCFSFFYFVAYRRLPSIIIPIDFGIFPVLRILIRRLWYHEITIFSYGTWSTSITVVFSICFIGSSFFYSSFSNFTLLSIFSDIWYIN